MSLNIEVFFDPNTWTVSYVVYDQSHGKCAIIDPVLDYNPKSGRISTASADRIMAFIQQQHLAVDWILDRARTTLNVWGDLVGAALIDRLMYGKNKGFDA